MPAERRGLEARTLRNTVTAAVAVLLGACAATPDATRDLPELPANLAKELVAARTAPVLMTGPLLRARDIPVPTTPLPLAPPRACTTVYEGYVTYPITVCSLPVLEQAIAGIARSAPATPAARSFEARHFKLSAHPASGVAFPPWFCTVRSGPWYAYIEGRQICNVDPNVRVFTAQMLGAPEPVVVTWTGALEEAPAPLKLVSVAPTGEFCVCCSGVMCPDGSCKPKFEHCQVKPPA
jgi:hypothetical protein